MLTIRRVQVKQLAVSTRESFLARMESHLRSHFPAETQPLPPATLREQIAKHWQQAEKYGLRSERGVCTYLNSVFALGADFKARVLAPWGLALLQSPLSETDKIARLRAGTQAVLTSRP